MSLRFYIHTMGCQMNEYDSELISGLLRAEGFEPALSAGEADIVLANTCAVRELAAEKAYSYLGSILKKDKKSEQIVVMCGCVAEQDGAGALKRMNGIDLVIGPSKIRNIGGILKDFLKNGRRKDYTGDAKVEWNKDSAIARSSGEKAWVTISKGCNSFCSYCVVPLARGREESRPREDIIETAVKLINSGCREINLIAQNVNTYGKDVKGGGNFAELLGKVASLAGKFRVGFKTAHPRDFSEELLQTVESSKKTMRNFHLPLQSGSDRVLKLMNRGYDTERYLEVAGKVRGLSGSSLTTDIIVGFPGETEEDFEGTLEMFARAAFDSAYMFKYSPRKGTAASKLGDTVPKGVKEERLARLMALQRKTGLANNKPLVGSEQEVLIDSETFSAGKVCGKTLSEKQVFFPAEKSLKGFVRVKITSAGPFSLKGEPVK